MVVTKMVKSLEKQTEAESSEKLVADERDNFKWRSWCKSVAYLNLTLLSLGLPAGIICVIMWVNAGVSVQQPGMEELSEESVNSIKKFAVIIAVTVLVSMSGIGIWASIKLINSTEIGCDPRKALELARFWKNVNLAFIGMALFGMLVTQAFVSCGVNDSVLICIVCQYINELEESSFAVNQTAAAGSNPDEEIKHPLEEPEVVIMINKYDLV